MSVKATLIAILVVAFAAFSAVSITLYRSVVGFIDAQEDTAEGTEELVLYMEMTIEVSRFVKEAHDEIKAHQGEQLEAAKATAEKDIRALEAAAAHAVRLNDSPEEVEQWRRRSAEIRAHFDKIAKNVDTAVAEAKAGRPDVIERLEAAMERDYDHGFLEIVGEIIKDERSQSRRNVELATKIAHETSVAGLVVVLSAFVSLFALVIIVGLRMRMIDRSIRTIVVGAERLAGGNMEQRVPDLGRNELGQIGRAFNRMADGLVEAQGKQIQAERLAAVGQAAASVGHDLRNPLGAIRNATHYIKRRATEGELGSNERVMRFFDIIDKELDSSAKIIGDLLDFARDRRMTVSACPLRPLVADAMSVVAPPRPTKIENRISETLPVVSVDKDQLRQALVNILQNASESVPEEREGHIVITAAADADEVTLSIKDNGAGIPEAERARIFEPFFTTKNKGTGLGLSITVGIIERHGGSIKVASEPGKGTTFHVHLPLRGGDDADIRPEPGGGVSV